MDLEAFKTNLKSDFIDLFSLPLDDQTKKDSEAVIEKFATEWADKIGSRVDSYIRSATVNDQGELI